MTGMAPKRRVMTARHDGDGFKMTRHDGRQDERGGVPDFVFSLAPGDIAAHMRPTGVLTAVDWAAIRSSRNADIGNVGRADGTAPLSTSNNF